MVTNGDDFRNMRCLFITVRWSAYCIFCLVAGYFMKDVIEQYQAKETYLGQSLKPITKIPTLHCIKVASGPKIFFDRFGLPF